MPMVAPLWTSAKEINDVPGLWHTVYGTCKRYNKAKCINSNLEKAIAKVLGRKVRYVSTYKGALHWSEFVDGEWHKFLAPIVDIKYAKMIDKYDETGEHFKMPKKCPFGAVEYLGPSDVRIDPPEVIKPRRDRHNQRVQEGKVVPGARFREPQAPWVVA